VDGLVAEAVGADDLKDYDVAQDSDECEENVDDWKDDAKGCAQFGT